MKQSFHRINNLSGKIINRAQVALPFKKKPPHVRGWYFIIQDQAVTLLLPFTLAITSSAILFGAGA